MMHNLAASFEESWTLNRERLSCQFCPVGPQLYQNLISKVSKYGGIL